MEKMNFVIVGGSSGIGGQLLKTLLSEGHHVWTYSRREPEMARQANCSWYPADFSEGNATLENLPQQIHGLAYCPGSIQLAPFHRIKHEQFLQEFKLNFLGAVSAIQQCLNGLKAAGSSSVVLFSTVAAGTGMPFHAGIASAKAAVEGLCKSLAAEYASSGIRFNCIAPALTQTPLAERLLNTPEKAEAAAKRHPLGRIGHPEDIAAAAEFLLHTRSSWMTGQVLSVDGGLGSLRVIN